MAHPAPGPRPAFLDAEWFESTKLAADRFLIHEPNNAEAFAIRARARMKLGERLAAAQDFSRAITNTARPAPELYLERAQAQVAEGGAHLAEALQGLEQGMAVLGPLVTLQSLAINVEVQQNRVDAALARIDKVMAQFPRKETWLARRGEILQQSGRNKEAAEAFQSALTALTLYPPVAATSQPWSIWKTHPHVARLHRPAGIRPGPVVPIVLPRSKPKRERAPPRLPIQPLAHTPRLTFRSRIAPVI